MDGQLSFATLDYAGKKKRTKRDVFLAEMAATVPWSVLEAVIAPHYPQPGPQGGRRAFPIAVMLRPEHPRRLRGALLRIVGVALVAIHRGVVCQQRARAHRGDGRNRALRVCGLRSSTPRLSSITSLQRGYPIAHRSRSYIVQKPLSGSFL